jgi:hypothetical protein
MYVDPFGIQCNDFVTIGRCLASEELNTDLSELPIAPELRTFVPIASSDVEDALWLTGPGPLGTPELLEGPRYLGYQGTACAGALPLGFSQRVETVWGTGLCARAPSTGSHPSEARTHPY